MRAAKQSGRIMPSGGASSWGHGFVQAQFAGELINRRKVYPAELRDVLARTFALRQAADYGRRLTTETQMARTLQRAREFVEAVRVQGGERT